MAGYEVWFANGKSSKMEKCTTIWKTKERAERYAAGVERLGYDTVILPHNFKSPKNIGQFGGTTREIEINGKKYQMWGFDTKSKSSANQYADQLRRTGKDVIVKESKTPESTSGWMIFARKRPGRKIGSFGTPVPKMGLTMMIDGKKYDLVYKDSNMTRFEKIKAQFAAKGYMVKTFDPNGRGFWYLYAREK